MITTQYTLTKNLDENLQVIDESLLLEKEFESEKEIKLEKEYSIVSNWKSEELQSMRNKQLTGLYVTDEKLSSLSEKQEKIKEKKGDGFKSTPAELAMRKLNEDPFNNFSLPNSKEAVRKALEEGLESAKEIYEFAYKQLS